MESVSESSPSVAQASKEVSQIAAAIALAVAASKKPWKQAYTPHLKIANRETTKHSNSEDTNEEEYTPKYSKCQKRQIDILG